MLWVGVREQEESVHQAVTAQRQAVGAEAEAIVTAQHQQAQGQLTTHMLLLRLRHCMCSARHVNCQPILDTGSRQEAYIPADNTMTATRTSAIVQLAK